MFKKIWNHPTTVGDWIIVTAISMAVSVGYASICCKTQNQEFEKMWKTVDETNKNCDFEEETVTE